MDYSKIELKGYERLQLNNIQLIRLEPKHLIQLILGTNGSGKSSLLREITPLPSSKDDYKAGGYKHLEINHRGNQYQVINRFDGKSVKFQMLKNGTDIFNGSTATDFRALVKQEFGLTPEIQGLINGVDKFSLMDVSKRRYWFTILSKADYTFAFEFYNKIRARIRDLQGAITVAQNRYANELAKLLSDEEMKEIRDRLVFYRDTVDKLLEHKPRTTFLKSDLERILSDKDRQMERLTGLIENLRRSMSVHVNKFFPYQEINPEICQQEYYRSQGAIDNLKETENKIRSRLEELFQDRIVIGEASELPIEDLVENKEKFQKQLEQLRSSLHIHLPLNSVTEIKPAFESVHNTLTDIFENLPEDDHERYNRQTRETSVRRGNEIQLKLNQLAFEIGNYQLKIKEMDHAKLHHERECPNCHHRWIHGYDESNYQGMKISLTKALQDEEKLTTDLKTVNELVFETDRVFDLRLRYRQVITNWPVLSTLWDKIDHTKPREALRRIDELRTDIPTLLRVDFLEKEIGRTDELIELAQRQVHMNLEHHQDLIHHTEEELFLIQEKIRYEEQRSRVFKTFERYFVDLERYEAELHGLLTSRQGDVSELENSLMVDHVNRMINVFKQEMSHLEQAISKIDIQKANIEGYKAQIAGHEKEIAALKIAEQAMSPSTGLIAKGLMGFINWYIVMMNQFVRHIWAYPLEILPINIDDELELDYKFPVKIDDRFPAPDIRPKDCNNSTCEIFDLAFRIVAMECLGLKDLPLQVDEFGSTFDAKHRNTSFQVVTNLTTTTDLTQVFMISHNEQSYGSLKNVDITLLHPDNVVIPEGVIVNGQTFIG